MKSNNFLVTRARPKKTKTIKEVLDAIKNKNKDKATTPLQQVLTSFLIRNKKTSPTLNASSAEKKAITLTNALKKRSKNQKTSIGIKNLYARNCS